MVIAKKLHPGRSPIQISISPGSPGEQHAQNKTLDQCDGAEEGI
jgi:hypothetical protein